MPSKYSDVGILWESVKFQVYKYKLFISISVALVFIIALIACIGISAQRMSYDAVEKPLKPESHQRSGASSLTGDEAVRKF